MKLKNVLLVVAVMVVTLICSNVYADNVANAYVYSAESIDGIYFYKHRNDTNEIKYDTHNFHEQAHFLRRNTDNRYVYCIESWAQLTGANLGDYNLAIDYNSLGIPKDKAELIDYYAYFGYGYKDEVYNHLDDKWYAITQYLIWEELSPEIEHYFVSSISSTEPIYPFENEINELRELVSNKMKITSIKENKYEVGLNEKITLVDDNNALSNYEIITNDYTSAKVDGNNLIISSSKPGINVVKLRKSNNYRFNMPSVYYTSDKYQNALLPGNLESDVVEIEVRVKSKMIRVTKYMETLVSDFSDEDGVHYNLVNIKDSLENSCTLKYGGKEITGISNNGVMEYSISDTGMYELKCYVGGNRVGRNILVSNDQDIYDMEFQELLLKMNLSLTKYGETFEFKDNNIVYTEELMSNVVFGLYNNNDELIRRFVTNEYGEIKFNEYIPYGNYYIKEISSKDNYQIDDNKYYVDFSVYNYSFKFDNIVNYYKKGNVSIIKLDSNSLLPIENVRFNLINNDQIINTYITNENGIIDNIILPYGEYKFIEVETPEGYIDNKNEYNFIIDDSNKEINLTILNDREVIEDEIIDEEEDEELEDDDSIIDEEENTPKDEEEISNDNNEIIDSEENKENEDKDKEENKEIISDEIIDDFIDKEIKDEDTFTKIEEDVEEIIEDDDTTSEDIEEIIEDDENIEENVERKNEEEIKDVEETNDNVELEEVEESNIELKEEVIITPITDSNIYSYIFIIYLITLGIIIIGLTIYVKK